MEKLLIFQHPLKKFALYITKYQNGSIRDDLFREGTQYILAKCCRRVVIRPVTAQGRASS